MHAHLDGMSDAQFEHIQHKWAPNWATASQETVAKSLAKAPFNLGGSAYKKAHAIRTLTTATDVIPDVASDPNQNHFLVMSKSLDSTRPWLYPKECTKPKRAVRFIYKRCKKTLKRIGVKHRFQLKLLKRIRHMSRGDEACFVCEAGKLANKLNARHIRVMTRVVQLGIQPKHWHHKINKDGTILSSWECMQRLSKLIR